MTQPECNFTFQFLPVCAIMAKNTLGGITLKYLKQMLVILAFTLVGEGLAKWIPLPIPAAIYGFVLLFLALCTGLLKPEHIDETASFLIGIMGIMYVAPAVNILAYYDVIAPQLVPVCVIVMTSTVVVFGVAGLVTQWLRKKGGADNG